MSCGCSKHFQPFMWGYIPRTINVVSIIGFWFCSFSKRCYVKVLISMICFQLIIYTRITICFWHRNDTWSYICDGITVTSFFPDVDISLFALLTWSVSDSSNTFVLFQNFILWRLECFVTSITGLRRLFSEKECYYCNHCIELFQNKIHIEIVTWYMSNSFVV